MYIHATPMYCVRFPYPLRNPELGQIMRTVQSFTRAANSIKQSAVGLYQCISYQGSISRASPLLHKTSITFLGTLYHTLFTTMGRCFIQLVMGPAGRYDSIYPLIFLSPRRCPFNALLHSKVGNRLTVMPFKSIAQ